MTVPSTAQQVAAHLMRTGKTASGAALASQLGVSRAAIHKAVEVLRAQGFGIHAVAGEGYTLGSVPDVLLAEVVVPRLAPESLGHGGWDHHAVLESTNTRAAELARAGAVHGTVVVAESQTAGRGRRGRSFVSPPGTGIYLSVVLRPAIHPSQAFRLTVCGALAVVDACLKEGLAARVKWPNDVYAHGKKLCGVLAEMHADMERIHHAILGIGVNVNTPVAAFGPEVASLASSVAVLLGRPVDRVAFCANLLAALTTWYNAALRDFPAVVAAARTHSMTLGTQVAVLDGERRYEGFAEDLDEDGALLVVTPDGTRRVVAGDVEPVGGAVGGHAGPRG